MGLCTRPGDNRAANWALLLLLHALLGVIVFGGLQTELARVGVFAVGVGVAVWVCGKAEQILGEHDPGSVVLDEIVAMPLCFATVLTVQSLGPGFTGAAGFLSAHPWWLVPALFAGFRLFDIWKPWPVGWADRELPGGLGVMADDMIAGLMAGVLVAVAGYLVPL